MGGSNCVAYFVAKGRSVLTLLQCTSVINTIFLSRMPQDSSWRVYNSKFSWGSMPPDPPKRCAYAQFMPLSIYAFFGESTSQHCYMCRFTAFAAFAGMHTGTPLSKILDLPLYSIEYTMMSSYINGAVGSTRGCV